MARVVHNKLVRDRILAIIEANGDQAETRVLSDEEYSAALNEKLREEVEEFIESEVDPSEIADIYEVIDAIKKLNGISSQEVEEIQQKKRQERGSFEGRIFLISTIKGKKG